MQQRPGIYAGVGFKARQPILAQVLNRITKDEPLTFCHTCINTNVVRSWWAKNKIMGWDAHTNAKKNGAKHQLSNKEQRMAFKEAFEFVKSEAGQVDAYLDMAGLDCSACAEMLERATGRDCWGDDWRAKDIQRIQDKSNWDFEYSKEDAWAYWSAKKFLELCARFKLTVTFSW